MSSWKPTGTMKERVAEAMMKFCYEVMEQRGDLKPDIYRRLADYEWEELAVAGIAAMREPTDEMVNAAEEFDWGPSTGSGDYANPFKVWQAMIDAA